MSSYVHYKVSDEITCCIFEFWEWISNFIQHFIIHFFNHPRCMKQSMLNLTLSSCAKIWHLRPHKKRGVCIWFLTDTNFKRIVLFHIQMIFGHTCRKQSLTLIPYCYFCIFWTWKYNSYWSHVHKMWTRFDVLIFFTSFAFSQGVSQWSAGIYCENVRSV